MVQKFEHGKALHQGQWVPVTTFLVVTEWGSEWCCFDGHHDRNSREVRTEIEISVRLLGEEAFS